MHERNEIPYTRINITLEFMNERGCVRVVGRKRYAELNFVFADAKVGWSVLARAGCLV